MTGVIKTDANGVVQTDANGVIQTVSSATAQLDVAIASTTSPVAPGDELGVTATVDNTGGAQGTQTITLDINNGVGQVDSASVTLSAGGSTTQALSWAVPSGQAEQDYTATVASADDSASQTVTVGSGPPASLVSHWTFDSADTNSGTAVDVVGSNDGTISGATTGVSGANQTYTTNEAYSFDGSDDSVEIPGTPDFSGQAFTLAAWVRPGNLSDTGNIIGQDDLGGNARNQRVRTNNGGIETRVFDGGSNQTAVIPSSKLSTGNWYHIVGVFNHSTNETKIYLNGSLEDTQSVNSAEEGLTDIQVGKSDGGPNYYTGRVDDARLYSKELTSTEVSNLYANGVIQTVSSPTAQFDVAIASTTSPVAPGDELGVTATVDNTGGAQGTQTITLDISNGVGQVDSASVTLSAGGSTTQTLSWAVPSGQAEQDYTATVSSADDTASQTVTVGSFTTSMFQNPIQQYSAAVYGGADGDSPFALPEVVTGSSASAEGSPTFRANQSGFAAAEYDGSNDGHNGLTANLPTGGVQVSFAALVYADSVHTGRLFTYGDDNAAGRRAIVSVRNGGGIEATVFGSSYSFARGGTYPTGQWITVGASFDTDTATAYLNGSSVATDGGSTYNVSDTESRIGYTDYANPFYFDGYIAEVVVSSAAEPDQTFTDYHNDRI
jgi:hypothetical protein